MLQHRISQAPVLLTLLVVLLTAFPVFAQDEAAEDLGHRGGKHRERVAGSGGHGAQVDVVG